MPRILIVMGMNSRRLPREKFEHAYLGALFSLLAKPEVGLRGRLPEASEVDLMYWTDLIPAAPTTSQRGRPVRLASGLLSRADLPRLADLRQRDAYFLRTLRRRVLALDALGEYCPWLEAPTPLGRMLRPLFVQTLLYMSDAHATFREDLSASPGLHEQTQARLRKMLTPQTALVIGHSLGSALAYEVLRCNPHCVDTLMTIGSPFGMRRMIYEPLGVALGDVAPYAWPGVEHWQNVSAARDVLFVPEPELGKLFRGPIQDLRVDHGSVWQPDLTHRLQNYLQHVEVGRLIARAWERALDKQVSRRKPRPSSPSESYELAAVPGSQ